ncbi:MAG: NADH-quinone oxidoreductase subunit L, partial [Candidatus Accumulibacter sp.]|nr:NADH-quinone oxidoreductase subunit L [Accumulibacter sp.]
HDDGKTATEHHGLAPGQKPHETPWVVTVPLILLAIPSVLIGIVTIEPMLFGGFFGKAIFVDAKAHPVMQELTHDFHGTWTMAIHALSTPVFWLAAAGVASAWFCYLKQPAIPAAIKAASGPIYTLLENKYYFDKFNELVIAGGARLLGRGLWKGGDAGIIDGLIVDGSVRVVGWISVLARLFQSGHIYHYAFTMILGVGVFLTLTIWLLLPLN